MDPTERLLSIARAAGLEQGAFADKMNVSTSAISMWKKRGRIPADAYFKAAEVLGCGIDYLVGDTGTEWSPRTSARLTGGGMLLAVAKALEGEDAFKRKAIASIVTDMLVNGARESAASAIDAVATVVVSLPAALGDRRSEASPLGVNDVDQHHESGEPGTVKSNESITVTPALSQVKGTQPGATKEPRWKKSLGTEVGGNPGRPSQDADWTPEGKTPDNRRKRK